MVATATSHKFQKGVSGNPSGKPKGTKDAPKFNFALICKEAGFNPCLELIKIARTAKSEHARVTACTEIASYVAPKLKAVEISPSDAKETFQMMMNFGKPNDNQETVADGIDNVQCEQDSK